MSKFGMFVSPVYYWVFPTWISILKRELDGLDLVLDLGCGNNSPLQYCKVKYKVGIDLFEPYLDEAKTKKIHNQYITGDITKYRSLVHWEVQGPDAIIASQVLEHIEKVSSYRVMREMEEDASKKVIIAVPNGWRPQDEIDDNPNNPHVSAWYVEDFTKRGYKVYGTHGLKWLRGYRGWLLGPKWIPPWMKETFSDLTQRIVYYYPKWAFQLLAVKTTSNDVSTQT